MPRRARPLALLAASVLAAACGGDDAPVPAAPPADPPYVPPPESCDAPDLDDLAAFPHCNTGSGVFGTWIVDDLGLPAYEYGLDQNADPRAAWFNTEGLDRREHWAAFGNSRVNAMSFNDGYIELTTQDRGETYVNKFDASQGNYAGGFSYLDDGAAAWSTAYRWRPAGSRTTRRFGMGYAEASMEHRGVRVLRRTFAPAGDAPLVIDEVTIENLSNDFRSLRHYEVWDVARRPVEINWVVSGLPFTTVPAEARKQRDDRNALFDEEVRWDPAGSILGLRRTHAAGVAPPPREVPDPVDYYPGDPFVAALVGEVADVYTDQATFFGEGGPGAPTAVASRAAGHGLAAGVVAERAPAAGQPRALILRSDLTLAAGEARTLRFAYGYAPMGAAWPIDEIYRDPSRDLLSEQAAELKKHLFLFAEGRSPELHREMAWHTYQMEASVGYREYWGTHVVPQGSAYLYLHGADGAARDLSLFAVPLVYTHPSLAREELALNMMVTHAADRRISYAFQGHGMLDDALGIHSKPSDLTLFLLWSLSEYIGATGDTAFLDAPMPFYPIEADPGATVWDHVHDAVRHLFDVVGTGEHGLIRVGTGDWSDGIVFEAPDRDLAIASGESVPNTQMAVAVLPRVADLVEPRDAALAAEIRARVDALRAALEAAWTGSFYGRAYFGDGDLAYAGTIHLEAQVWPLIADIPTPSDRAALIAEIRAQLDDPSPMGATLLPGGQVWPAISALLTWGYARTDPDLALAHLARNTMAARAVAYPEVWYGIWSGPDGVLGPGTDRPGEAWYSQVTPMTDFPTMNNNQHAMPILAALRAAGIEATATGLRLDPRSSARTFSLSTELLDLSQRGSRLSGAYRPTGAGARTLEIVAPPGSTIASATQDGAPVAVPPGSTSITLQIPPAGASAFEVEITP